MTKPRENFACNDHILRMENDMPYPYHYYHVVWNETKLSAALVSTIAFSASVASMSIKYYRMAAKQR
jgi:hypothetical protein